MRECRDGSCLAFGSRHRRSNRQAIRCELQGRLLRHSESCSLVGQGRPHHCDNFLPKRSGRPWPFYPIGHEGSRSFACAVVGRGICTAWHSRERSESRPDQHAVSRQARTFREATQRSGLGNRESGPTSSFRRGRGNRKGSPVSRERRFLLHDRIGTGRGWRPDAAITAPAAVRWCSLPGEMFVGREAELGSLLTVLDEAGPVLVYVHGIAGVGKSALVSAFAGRARSAGATVVPLDCRSIEPTDRGFIHSLASAVGSRASTPAAVAGGVGGLGRR